MAYVIGVDVGGTFTDAVLDDDAGTVLAAKSPSTPPDYSRGVLDVLELLAEQLGVSLPDMLAGTHHIAHGTTSSLNALVMGNVPPVGFLTTKGHRDSIFIMNVEGRYLGRSPNELQNVLGQAKDHGLLPKRHALEVTERIDRDGTIVVGLDEDEARAAIRSLLDDGIRAIAVSLLWSFRNPRARAAAARAGRRAGPRGVRRAVLRGQPPHPGVLPQRHHHHEHPDRAGAAGLPDRAGGHPAGEPARRAAAGHAEQRRRRGRQGGTGDGDQHGRLGAHRRRRRLGRPEPPARPPQRHLHRRGRHHVPRRPGGRRRARPRHHHRDQPPPDQRAHAAGRRDRLRRRRDRLARRWRQPADRPAQRAGRSRPRLLRQRRHRSDQHRRQPRPGDPPRAGAARRPQAAVAGAGPPGHRHQIAKPLGLSVEEAAAAIYTVQNAQTGDLLRKTVVEAGHDPREFVLYAFGGAGPAHCARYAAEVGVSEVVVPLGPVASAFSAFGLASSDIALAAELSDPAIVPFDPARAEQNFADLEKLVREGLDRQGVRFEAVRLHREIDMRYAMQLAEVTAPVAGGPLDTAAIEAAAAAFEHRYAALYGADAASARLASRPSPSGSAGSASCRSPRYCPRSRPLPRRIRRTRRPAAARSASTPRRATSTRRSTTTASCGPGTCSTAPRSSRSRPPPWSSRAAPPARWTRSAT